MSNGLVDINGNNKENQKLLKKLATESLKVTKTVTGVGDEIIPIEREGMFEVKGSKEGGTGVGYKEIWNNMSNEEKAKYLPPFKIDKVKASVAAGDAFTGILGASISSGLDIFDSLEIAIIGSALSTTKNGAQESMPYYSEIIKELD